VDLAIEDAGASWHAQLINADGTAFRVHSPQHEPTVVEWNHCGRHNVENGLAAMAAAHHVGVTPAVAAEALARFRGVKRRLELLGTVADIRVYDDFAHHPTAIASTLEGIRAGNKGGRILTLIEPRSNTMRMGEHRKHLALATKAADRVFWFQPAGMDWSLERVISESPVTASLSDNVDTLAREVASLAQSGDTIVIMSNGSFGGIHQKLLTQLEVINA